MRYKLFQFIWMVTWNYPVTSVSILPDPSHLYSSLQLISCPNTQLLLGSFQQSTCFGRTKIQQHYRFRRRIFWCFLDRVNMLFKAHYWYIKSRSLVGNFGFPDSDQFYKLVQGKKHGVTSTGRKRFSDTSSTLDNLTPSSIFWKPH